MIGLVISIDKRDGCIQGTTSLIFGKRMIQQTAQYQFVATPDVLEGINNLNMLHYPGHLNTQKVIKEGLL
jgi:hypothetical protein